jgi:hypothetical protein
MKPVLLSDRPEGQGLIVSMVVPVVFGALAGWALGVSEPAYLVLALLGIAGGYFAGLEHDYPIDGVYRGMLGGLLFGSAILITNGILDKEPEAHLPDPETLLIAITAAFGTVLGWLGARSRAKREARDRSKPPEAPMPGYEPPPPSAPPSA